MCYLNCMLCQISKDLLILQNDCQTNYHIVILTMPKTGMCWFNTPYKLLINKLFVGPTNSFLQCIKIKPLLKHCIQNALNACHICAKKNAKEVDTKRCRKYLFKKLADKCCNCFQKIKITYTGTAVKLSLFPCKIVIILNKEQNDCSLCC